jgi:hypothetical protein
MVLVPPLDEQVKIADYLDEQTKILTAMQKQINLLNEFRSSVISHAVIGELDIPTKGNFG